VYMEHTYAFATRLPSYLRHYVVKAARFGTGLTDKFAATLTNGIQNILGKGNSLVDMGIKRGKDLIGQFIGSYKNRINQGIAQVQQIVRGKIARTAGQITNVFNGLGAKYATMFKKALPRGLQKKVE